MTVLTHPTIRDGWFREVSSEWPGQAMALKVRRILHIEKSSYQDILVFESETYGNVLVLDSVVQCTERDEFSYQELIAHLPLASHPDPKKVLVVGGGDGGVVREVLKHNTVEQVILCDIDEAVIKAGKKYLPHMSALLSDARVTLVIRDGFEFLSENTSTYDVIITDSSDPDGPAQSLFESAYFRLIHSALTEGGNFSIQAESLWLHLPSINDLRLKTKDIFPVVEYAYAPVPTYPSGQIGFVLCSKDPRRNLNTPVRKVSPSVYYNERVHRTSFILPEFGRVLVEEDKTITPKFGRPLPPADPVRTVLLLGSGFVAKPAAEYILRDNHSQLTVGNADRGTVACRTLEKAQNFIIHLPRSTAISLDVCDAEVLEKTVAEHDLVISLIPCTYHADVIKAAIKGKTHVVSASHVSCTTRALHEEAAKAGIVIVNEVGLDPGIDHLYAAKTIDDIHAKRGKIKQFFSYCGGLPAPECSGNPLGYKFSWSPKEALLALVSPASYLWNGKQVDIEGKDLMKHAKPYFVSPAYALVAYPNGNSMPFREWYNIPEADTIVRGTLRYQGFPEFICVLVKIGFLDAVERPCLNENMTWAEVTQKAIGAADARENTLIARIKELAAFPDVAKASRVIAGLKWIGLFSEDKIRPRSGNLLDTLCSRLEALIPRKKGERDLVMLQHKFVVEWEDGKENTITSTLERYGSPLGHSAVATIVGGLCGSTAQLILDGVIHIPGVLAPFKKDIRDPIREALESEGIGMVEKVL